MSSNSSVLSNPLILAKVRNRLTKFEITRLLCARAAQLDEGAKSVIDPKGLTSSLMIANREYQAGKIPCIVQRNTPTGKVLIDPRF